MTEDRLTTLYKTYGPAICIRCRSILSDEAEAHDATHWSGLLSAAAVVEGAVRVSERWLASLLVRAPATFMRLDGSHAVRFTPAAWAGAGYAW